MSKTMDEGDSGGRLQRISSRIKDIVVGGAAGSTTSSSEDQPQDQGYRRLRNSGQIIHVDTEDQEDLHRQRSGAEVFYIYRYQVVVFLVISISPHCNLGLFQSGVGSVWISSWINDIIVRGAAAGSRTSSSSGQHDLRPQRISRRIKDIVGGGAAGSTTSTEENQMKGLRRQGSTATTSFPEVPGELQHRPTEK